MISKLTGLTVMLLTVFSCSSHKHLLCTVVLENSCSFMLTDRKEVHATRMRIKAGVYVPATAPHCRTALKAFARSQVSEGMLSTGKNKRRFVDFTQREMQIT